MRHSWSTYAGVGWAPFGKLAEDGFRMRVTGGGGQYRYQGVIDREPVSIYGTSAFGDLLVGYQMGLGRLTLKAFAGATFDGQLLDPWDDANRLGGAATGAKLVVESWLNITPALWTQLDASYATANETYYSRLRVGYRVLHGLSLGLEGGSFGNITGDSARAGIFARYEWLGGEISASGGVSGELRSPRSPYATLVYLKRF